LRAINLIGRAVFRAFHERDAQHTWRGRARLGIARGQHAQVVGHADVAPQVPVARDQHHPGTRRRALHRLNHGQRQRGITRALSQRHRREHGRRQRAAMTHINFVQQRGLLLAGPAGGRRTAAG